MKRELLVLRMENGNLALSSRRQRTNPNKPIIFKNSRCGWSGKVKWSNVFCKKDWLLNINSYLTWGAINKFGAWSSVVLVC